MEALCRWRTLATVKVNRFRACATAVLVCKECASGYDFVVTACYVSLVLALAATVSVTAVIYTTDRFRQGTLYKVVGLYAFCAVYIVGQMVMLAVLFLRDWARLDRLDRMRRAFVLHDTSDASDVERGDTFDEAKRPLAAHDFVRPPHDSARQDAGASLPAETRSTGERWPPYLLPSRWTGWHGHDHVRSEHYIMRIDEWSRVDGDLYRIRGRGSDSTGVYVCRGYAARDPDTSVVRFAWVQIYTDVYASTRLQMGDGTLGTSVEFRGCLFCKEPTLDDLTTLQLRGKWHVEYLTPDYALPGQLAGGDFCLVNRAPRSYLTLP